MQESHSVPLILEDAPALQTILFSVRYMWSVDNNLLIASHVRTKIVLLKFSVKKKSCHNF